MKMKFQWWMTVLRQHPRAAINIAAVVVALLVLIGGLLYAAFRPIDVLKDWKIEIASAREYRDVMIDGKKVNVPVYNPGDSLLFTSTSEKLENADGTTYRYIVCIPTGSFKEKEILIDTQPAVRPIGKSPKRENFIPIPSVSQFAGLPRLCKLVIDIGYDSVSLQRDWNEHAETGLFLVEEQELDADEARKLINELQKKIEQLEAIAARTGAPVSSITVTPDVVSGQTPVPVSEPTTAPATPQKAAVATPPQAAQPSILTQVDNLLVDTWNGITNVLH
jgi:hypothetical protein